MNLWKVYVDDGLIDKCHGWHYNSDLTQQERMMRKTIAVNDIVDYVNDMLANSIDSPEAQSKRVGALQVLEMVLHATGNYKGYRYLLTEEVYNGRPGVRYETNENGIRVPCKDYTERFENCDNTRRQY